MAWRIVSIETADPTRGLDTVAAARIYLEGTGGETASSTVELAETAHAAGVAFDPRAAVERFLSSDEVPPHLLVTSYGEAVPAAD